MDLFRERRTRRNCEQREEAVEVLGCLRQEVAVPPQHLAGAVDRPDGDCDTHGVHRVQPEVERGDDAEVPATAAQRPEQVRVLGLARGDETAVGEHDVRGQQIVHRQTVLAGQVAVTAAEGEASDARCRHDAGGGGEAEGVCGMVEIAENTAAAHPGGLRGGVDAHPAHRRQVDGDAVVHQTQARAAVSAAPYGEFETVVADEIDRIHHIRRVRAPHHGSRLTVDHCVVDLAGLVVLRVLGADDRTAQGSPHSFQSGAVHRDLLDEVQTATRQAFRPFRPQHPGLAAVVFADGGPRPGSSGSPGSLRQPTNSLGG